MIQYHLAELQEKLDKLKVSLLEVDVVLDFQVNPNMYDRKIRLDNRRIIKIGRDLDFYQTPKGGFFVGANNLSLMERLEIKGAIFKALDVD